MAETKRSKHNFTAGEVSPLMWGREDFDRYKNGCKVLRNMVVKIQGPTTRRSGFQFILDLETYGLDTANPTIRLVDFVFNELQSYVIVFFNHTSGVVRAMFLDNSGPVVYPDPPTGECPPGTPVTPTEGDTVVIDMPAGFDADVFDYAQSGDYLYMVQTGLPLHALIRHAEDCWEILEITVTDQPSDWSDVNGWPETITLFQQRMALGGNTLYRQKVWCSRAGDFHHFGSLDPANIVAADAVSFTLDSGSDNIIQWLQTVRRLHASTLGNEWVIKGNGTEAISPTDGVVATSDTNNGSERIRPLRIGSTTLFVERHGRVVNEFLHDYYSDSFDTTDITVLAPHLTDDFSIKRWAYQQTPDSIVWCVREDGEMLALTYQRKHNVVAWTPQDTQGEFIDVAVKPGDTREEDVWVAVKRSIGGDDKYYIEKKAPNFKSDTSEDGRFLDSFLVYEGAETDVLTGLDHLEGEEISIIVNGAQHANKTVTSGLVELDYDDVTQAVAGLPFVSEVRPLIPGIIMDDGNTTVDVQRINELHIQLYKSSMMEIGRYASDEDEVVEDQPGRESDDLTDTALPLMTETYQMDFQEGYGDDVGYFIRQSDPFPLTILSITDVLEVA
jgi:hypothetical protein